MITAHQHTSSNIACNSCTTTLPNPLMISKPTLGSTTILMTTINPKLSYWHHQLVLNWCIIISQSHIRKVSKSSCIE